MQNERLICCYQDVHVRELIARIRWTVQMRWLVVGATFLLALIGLVGVEGLTVTPTLPFGVGIFLIVTNIFYGRQIRKSDEHCVGTLEMRRLCFVQVLGDYAALAVIVYVLGSVETPVMFMILPNMILATLFFTRRQSLYITLMGFFLMMTPMLLERAEIIPTVHLYESGFKVMLYSNTIILSAFIAVLYSCVIFCWYIASTITASLIKNELELEDSYQTMILLDEEKTKATLRGTHELKAPLAAIKSYVYTLRDGYAGELPDKAQAIVMRVGERCDRLLSKITDIIRLGNLKSYVNSGEQYQEINVVEVLTKDVGEAEQVGSLRGITINYRYNRKLSGPLIVDATNEHLNTLFTNLLINAVNYSHDQGVVDVELKRVEAHAVISIRDHGIGIASEHHDKIFDEHFRTQVAADHHANGTGLGLPIVKTVIQLLHARMELESEVGQWTCFTIAIPLIEPRE